MKKRILTILLIASISITTTYGQHKANKGPKMPVPVMTKELSKLYYEILKQDSLLFAAFNNCDTIEYRKHFTADLEFYHDKGGLHYLDEEILITKTDCDRNAHFRRELLKNTLEVHKLGNYGALEIGVHRIYHTNKGEPEHISGDFKFIHVWKNENGVWKISRIISYDHTKVNNN